MNDSKILQGEPVIRDPNYPGCIICHDPCGTSAQPSDYFAIDVDGMTYNVHFKCVDRLKRAADLLRDREKMQQLITK